MNLDITWLKDASLEDADALPPEVIAQEIVEDLEAALRGFAAIAEAPCSRKLDAGVEADLGAGSTTENK